MYSNESASDQTPTYEALGIGSGYELTEAEKDALPTEVRYMLGITSEAMQRSFTDSKDMTRTMTELTGLEREALVELNRKFRHDGLVEPHIDPTKPLEIRLLLTAKGKQFLDEHLT